jgi:hypothetical protein
MIHRRRQARWLGGRRSLRLPRWDDPPPILKPGRGEPVGLTGWGHNSDLVAVDRAIAFVAMRSPGLSVSSRKATGVAVPLLRRVARWQPAWRCRVFAERCVEFDGHVAGGSAGVVVVGDVLFLSNSSRLTGG